MIATKRLWTAKPFLVAYVIVVGVTVGLLVNRNPTDDRAVTTLAPDEKAHSTVPWESEARGEPLWLQIFRPSQPTARILLRTGLPILTLLDQGSQANRNLEFWTAAEEKPQTLFQSVLPFLRPSATGQGDTSPTSPRATGPGAQSPTGQAASGQGQASAGVKPSAGTEKPQSTGTSPGSGEPPLPPAPVPAQVIRQGAPLIGIYHTHDWESYISEFPTMKVQAEDDLNNVKSDDHKKRTVTDLGVLLAQNLRDLGVSTVHAPGTHQSLGYAYAYQASRDTARRIMKEAGTVRILIDLHRDSAWGVDTTAEVKGQQVATIRCIIGKTNSHWEKNKQFCDSMIQRLNKAYPGIVMPTREQDYTYNQDLMPGAVLLEIGGALNQYVEAQRSVKYLAQVLAEMVREGAYPQE